MKNYFNVLAKKIARTMLFIKATSYRKLPLPPYTWASGMKMRIYNDNRMLLQCYTHRMRVGLGFRNLINTFVKLLADQALYILGTSTAGIAPAATVAQLMKKKMIINHDDKFYRYEDNLIDKDTLKYLKTLGAGAIVSTTPFAIPYGVQYANALKIGFAYKRKTAKNHGKEKDVEGNLKPNQKVILMSCTFTDKDIEEALMAEKRLKELGYEVIAFSGITLKQKRHSEIDHTELQNEAVVVIEDLFSTGGSAAYEVYQLRKAGAVCDYCFSIFSYGFNILKKQFSGESMIGTNEVKLLHPCYIASLLQFSTLIEEMERMNFYPPHTREEMAKEINEFDENHKKFINLSPS